MTEEPKLNPDVQYFESMISIIVPIYNVEPFLPQCIESILHQTYRNLEILLIDDGSTDRCGEICDEYARIDTRIRVFHIDNRGLAAARNLGIRESRGEYIGFVDSDDWIEPNMYEILLQRLIETGSDISACDARIECGRNHPPKEMPPQEVYKGIDAIRAMIYSRLRTCVWNKIYKRILWNSISFPEGHTSEDIATLYIILMKAHAVSYIPEFLYHYRMRDNSITHDSSMENILDSWNACYNRYLFLSSLIEIRNDAECMNKMEKLLAMIAFRMWRWIYGTPKKQRDYEALRQVSVFAHNHFRLFGNENWGFVLRIGAYLTRYENDYVYAGLFFLNQLYRLIKDFRQQLTTVRLK